MTALAFRLTDSQALDDSARRMAALLDLSRVTVGIADYRRVQERILVEGRVYLEYLHRCYRQRSCADGEQEAS